MCINIVYVCLSTILNKCHNLSGESLYNLNIISCCLDASIYSCVSKSHLSYNGISVSVVCIFMFCILQGISVPTSTSKPSNSTQVCHVLYSLFTFKHPFINLLFGISSYNKTLAGMQQP